MVEHQLPKLNTRVRFPSSAPKKREMQRISRFFAIAFGVFYKERRATKEQYLALMDRTFDAYGADGVRLLGGIGNRNGRYDRYRAVGWNCVHLFIRAEQN